MESLEQYERLSFDGFCFCFSGVKLNLLNKEVYGYMLQPSDASKNLKDMRISFTHVKLEWFGKSGWL